MTEPFEFTPLEIAANVITGEARDHVRLPDIEDGLLPVAALEEAVLRAVRDPPCFVAFSGGRDSSTVLTVATQVARKNGLPLPIPLTLRFEGAPDTDESEWQELVVRTLQLSDWHRQTLGDELDLLGPIARRVLLRHGLLWPAGAYAHLPMMEAARGGWMLTGIDGDTLFGAWRRARLAGLLAGRVRPRPSDVVGVALALGPTRLRGRRHARLEPLDLPWLVPSAKAEIQARFSEEAVSEPVSWRKRIAWYRRRRQVALFLRAFELLADDAGTRLVHPFMDGGFLAAVARAGGRAGFLDRTAAMQALFSAVLPNALLTRTHKALFDAVFFGPDSRDFFTRWNGGGIPSELVDETALRESWENEPNPRADLLLHSAWLSTRAVGEADKQVDGP